MVTTTRNDIPMRIVKIRASRSADTPSMPAPDATPLPASLLRAEIVRILVLQGSHFRGNALLVVSMPEILATEAAVKRLEELRDGLRTLTDLASGSAPTGPVAPEALVRHAVAIVEAAAPYESIEVDVESTPERPLVGEESDRALLSLLVVVLDARRRIRDTGRAGRIRIEVATDGTNVAITLTPSVDVGPTRYGGLYALARLAGAVLEGPEPTSVPVLYLAADPAA